MVQSYNQGQLPPYTLARKKKMGYIVKYVWPNQYKQINIRKEANYKYDSINNYAAAGNPQRFPQGESLLKSKL